MKQQIDFNKQRRIVFTGSATPLVEADAAIEVAELPRRPSGKSLPIP